MTQIDLKEQVRQALSTEWPAFAQSHPRLAAVLDQQLLIQQAAEQLADDPEYRRVMSDAATTGSNADAALAAVTTFVRGLIRSLL